MTVVFHCPKGDGIAKGGIYKDGFSQRGRGLTNEGIHKGWGRTNEAIEPDSLDSLLAGVSPRLPYLFPGPGL